jgi:hypothetical protein
LEVVGYRYGPWREYRGEEEEYLCTDRRWERIGGVRKRTDVPLHVLGHRCTPEGQLPDESRVSTIQKWGPCQSLSEVRTFLGTVGVVWIFIKNFSLRAHPLIK